MIFDTLKTNISNLIGKVFPQTKRADEKIGKAQAANDAQTSYPSMRPPEWMFPPVLQNYFQDEKGYAQYAKYEAVRKSAEMYYTDGRVQAAINKLALKATQKNSAGRPFDISIGTESKRENEQLEKEFDAVMSSKDVSIYRRSKNFARDLCIEGRPLYRNIVDVGAQRIVAIKKIKGPRSGFVVAGPLLSDDKRINGGYVQIEKDSGKIVNFFFGWEVLEFRWNYDEELGTGVPLTIAAKKHFDRTNESEKFVFMARKSRAWKRLVHELEGITTPDQLKQWHQVYQEINQSRGSDDPFSDIYSNAKVHSLDESSPSLWNINDIEHHEGGLFDANQTPRALYSAGAKDVPNRSVMDVLYDEWVASYVATVEEALTGSALDDGILSLLELQFNLMGRSSVITPVSLIWPSKSRVTDDEISALEKGYNTGRLSETTYFARLLAVDWKEEQEKRLAEQKFLVENEIEISKIVKDKKQKMAQNKSNNDDAPETDEIDDSADKAVEELKRTLKRERNGYYVA